MSALRLARPAAVLLLLASPAAAQSVQQEAQAVVDRSTLAVQEIFEGNPSAQDDPRGLLRRARAVLVCPRILRAGFIFGGQGGSCVLLGRDGGGSWSSPAFYGLGSASFGLQAGVQDMQVLMMVLTERGLTALLDSQFKIGADASISIATIGAGVSGATTSAGGADIVAVARSRGLFAGVALEGTLLSAESDWNRAYYGQDVGAREIVLRMQAHNPGADPLRAALMRYGAGGPAVAPPSTLQPQPMQPAPMQTTPLAPPGRVESAPLPPINSR